MARRDFEHEQYKRKKRLPAPEVAKPKNHHRPEKNILIQYRYTEEALKEKGKNPWWPSIKILKENKWRTQGKYIDVETAQMVMEKDKLKWPEYRKQYEYRIIHKDDYLKEKIEAKETKGMMKVTEQVLKKDWNNPEEDKAWEKL